ncbi:MAG: hypothetical protein KF869_07915 [Phycisphaeraceae bacterium]|nr:hypothetical protein [Phycisphaeraceae bacterium]
MPDPSLQPTPEVFDLMTLSGQLRRVVANDLEKRLLEKAAHSADRLFDTHETPAGYSGELVQSREHGRVLVGAGRSFDFDIKRARSELQFHLSTVTDLPASACSRLLDILDQAARWMFSGRFAGSLGFIGILPVIQANRPNSEWGLIVKSRTPGAVLRVEGGGSGLVVPEPMVLGAGDAFDLLMPVSLLAVPEGRSTRRPASSRRIEYSISAPLLPEGPQLAVQTGFGISHPQEISDGRWFPSGKQGRRRDTVDRSDISAHPVIFIGRLAEPLSHAQFRGPCVDLVLCTANPAQHGSLDFIGIQSTSAALSSVLRWELWEVLARWADIDGYRVLDSEQAGELEISGVTEGKPRRASKSAPRSLRTAAWQDAVAGSPFLMDLFAMEEELDAEARPHLDRLKRWIQLLDSVRHLDAGVQEAIVAEVNNRLSRLGVHLRCPTCGTSSVLLWSKPRPESRFRGGISAQHVLADDRTKHVPKSWTAFTGFESRRAVAPGSASASPLPR